MLSAIGRRNLLVGVGGPGGATGQSPVNITRTDFLTGWFHAPTRHRTGSDFHLNNPADPSEYRQELAAMNTLITQIRTLAPATMLPTMSAV